MPTNFLDAAGTSGFIATPFNLLSTELNSLANGGAALSSVGGTSGVFSQTNWANAVWTAAWFKAGGAFGGSPVVGGFLALWFLKSTDGGTTFEKTATASTTVPPVPRAADITFPLINAAYAAGDITWLNGPFVKAPWESHKVVLWNMSGQAMASSGNLVLAGPVATQY